MTLSIGTPRFSTVVSSACCTINLQQRPEPGLIKLTLACLVDKNAVEDSAPSRSIGSSCAAAQSLRIRIVHSMHRCITGCAVHLATLVWRKRGYCRRRLRYLTGSRSLLYIEVLLFLSLERCVRRSHTAPFDDVDIIIASSGCQLSKLQ